MKSLSLRKHISYLQMLFFTLALPSHGFAQKNISLDQILVQDSASSSSSTVSADTIEKKQERNLGDTLRDVEDVTVGGNQNSNQKIYVRGLEDNNLNVTIDGARQSQNMFYHQGRFNIDPQLLKKVKVEAGTGDALSGPGALGGSLRFVTKDVDDLLAPGQKLGAMLKGEYATNADEKTSALAIYGRPTENSGLLFYGNYSIFNDYSAGGGDRVPLTGGQPYSYLSKYTWHPSSEQKISISRNERQDNATRYNRANFGSAGGVAISDQNLKTTINTLSYAAKSGGPWLDLQLDVYSSTNQLQYSSSSSSTWGDWESYGGTFKNSFVSDMSSLTVGGDYNFDHAKGRSTSDVISEKARILGLFAQEKYVLAPEAIIGVGARFDDYQLIQVDNSEINKSHISPNIKLNYVLNAHWDMELLWSQAFKGATPAQAFLLGGVRSVIPSEDLAGSVAETSQWGLHYKKNNITSDLSIYDTLIKDSINISINRTTGTLTRKNISPIRAQGLSFNTGYKEGLYQGKLGYSHNKVRFGSEPLGYTAYNIGSGFGDRFVFDFERFFPGQNISINWSSMLALEMTDVPAGQKSQPGYDVHDLSLTWSPKEEIRCGVAIRNIFDKKYVSQGTVYMIGSTEVPLYEEGRDFRLSTSIYF